MRQNSYMPPPSGPRPMPTSKARQTFNPGGQPLPQQANPMARQAMMAKALRGMPGSAPAPMPQPMPTGPIAGPGGPMPTGPIADLTNPGPMPAGPMPGLLPGSPMPAPTGPISPSPGAPMPTSPWSAPR